MCTKRAHKVPQLILAGQPKCYRETRARLVLLPPRIPCELRFERVAGLKTCAREFNFLACARNNHV